MSRRQFQGPEVLAPAGDDASMMAAVQAGADAVYFGLHGFNARARAKNFDIGALEATMRTLHTHGVNGYVTLNTLVFDDELESLESAVLACAHAGVDAVIVQDLGVLEFVRTLAPGMEVHASTQMTCTDSSSVKLAAKLGASRVILARELSLDDIRTIRQSTSVDVEVFVHGALCIAYSGQCLTSEAIGGRSANRGACAQACRLEYAMLVDGVLKDLGERAYLLSPQDLEASQQVPSLIAAGVRSLKIEGRLKGPAYVAASVRLYRAAVDAALNSGAGPHQSAVDVALQTFSRGSGTGFFTGVNHQSLVEGRSCDHRGVEVARFLGVHSHRGRDFIALELHRALRTGDGLLVEGGLAGANEFGGRVWSLLRQGVEIDAAAQGERVWAWFGPEKLVPLLQVGRRVFRNDAPSVEREILHEVSRSPAKIPLRAVVTGRQGGPLEVTAVAPLGRSVTVATDVMCVAASDRGIDEVLLREKLGQLGDSPFVIASLEVKLEGRLMLPVSSLKKLRRAMVQGLLDQSHTEHKVQPDALALVRAASTPGVRAVPRGGVFVLCRNLEQVIAAVHAKADGVILDFLELTGTGEAMRTVRAMGDMHVTVAPPRIRKPGEEKIDRFLHALRPDAFLVRGLGALYEGRSDGEQRVGDFSLNVANPLTAARVMSFGLDAFTPSFDLDARQLLTLLRTPWGPYAEVVVHHPMPLFYMEHCVIAATLSDGKDHRDCGRPCDRHRISLRDRAGMEHPVEADVGCRNTVFHGTPQSAADVIPEALTAGVKRFRIELVRETPEQVGVLVRLYKQLIAGEIAATDLRRELRVAGGYGVVRGSLRVLEEHVS